MASIGSALGNLSDLTIGPLKGLARSLGLRRPGAGTDAGSSQPIGFSASEEIPSETGPQGDPASVQAPPTQVVFLPRDPRWAYVFWSIHEADRQRALAAGASSLCLRLADVTGITGDSRPHALQEIVVDSQAVEWFLPVPVADRDYRVELGYRSRSGWISLAFSQIARMPADAPTEVIADHFTPFHITGPTSVEPEPVAAAPAGQHERLYQQSVRRLWRHGSEVFIEEAERQTGGDRHGLSDSGVGPWASGRSASGVGGVLPRQRSFWLVADAELIVYGATDPAATLTVGEEVVPLAADGTFRIQVPFRDGEQLYPIQATAADGEQKRSITMHFDRTTPNDRTNPRDNATAEWF